MNYNDKNFRVIDNSDNGEVSQKMIFTYKQTSNILTSKYSGGKIIQGHLIGVVSEKGIIEMSYHQVNTDGEIMTGTCTSTPEFLPNHKIRLHESWQWTSDDKSKGKSILEEI